ncbi:MAG: hypothetical protein R3A13_10150 [Bdellovibrionota bacterium]
MQPAILFKGVFRRELEGLTFAGAYKGPYLGTMEMQARLSARIHEQGTSFIDQETYRQGITEEREIRIRSPRPQFPHPDYVAFTDSIAKLAGCFPELNPSDPLVETLSILGW